MTAHPTHEKRASQHHGEDLPEPIQPGDGDAVRMGLEKSKLEMETEDYKAKRVASKAKDKQRAVEYKAERERARQPKPGIFSADKFKCWATGSTQKERI